MTDTNLESRIGFDQTVVAAPVLSKAFAPTIVSAGQAGTLTFTINNNTTIPLDNLLGFTDTVPAGITVTGLNTNGCPGTVVTTATTVTYTTVGGNILADSAVCTITVNIVGVTLGGPYTNTVIGNKSLTGQTPTAQITVIAPPDSFVVRYAANLTNGDAVIDLSNTGANGASLNGPGFGGAVGNICVNVYAFSPDEQLISCCSCLITPNGLVSLSVNGDLISNTLTGVRPNSIVVKLVNTGAGAGFSGIVCTNSAAQAGTAGFPLAGGLLAFGTTVHPGAAAGAFATTETPFSRATLSAGELASINNRCTNIVGNGSSFGICRSCRAGGLASDK